VLSVRGLGHILDLFELASDDQVGISALVAAEVESSGNSTLFMVLGFSRERIFFINNGLQVRDELL